MLQTWYITMVYKCTKERSLRCWQVEPRKSVARSKRVPIYCAQKDDSTDSVKMSRVDLNNFIKTLQKNHLLQGGTGPLLHHTFLAWIIQWYDMECAILCLYINAYVNKIQELLSILITLTCRRLRETNHEEEEDFRKDSPELHSCRD